MRPPSRLRKNSSSSSSVRSVGIQENSTIIPKLTLNKVNHLDKKHSRTESKVPSSRTTSARHKRIISGIICIYLYLILLYVEYVSLLILLMLYISLFIL